MNTGQTPSTTINKNVNRQNKKVIPVNGPDLMAQGESRARMDRMDLKPGASPMMKPSNRDTYQ